MVPKTGAVGFPAPRMGWVITGTANGVRFDGYIGERWGRFFIIIDPELRKAANYMGPELTDIPFQESLSLLAS